MREKILGAIKISWIVGGFRSEQKKTAQRPFAFSWGF
jgi:hypothetical protein